MTIVRRRDGTDAAGRVAVVGGGGADREALEAALERGCETYVTGGVFTKWAEEFLALAESSGIAVVDGTHYGTEKPPQLAMVDWFRIGLEAEFIPDGPKWNSRFPASPATVVLHHALRGDGANVGRPPLQPQPRDDAERVERPEPLSAQLGGGAVAEAPRRAEVEDPASPVVVVPGIERADDERALLGLGRVAEAQLEVEARPVGRLRLHDRVPLLDESLHSGGWYRTFR